MKISSCVKRMIMRLLSRHPYVETSTQGVDVSQLMDIQEEDGNNDACLMLLRTLMDIHIVVTRHVTSTETVSHTVISESSKGKVYKQKNERALQTIHRSSNRAIVCYLIEMGKTAKEAALLTQVNIRTAHHTSKNTMMTRNDVCR